MIEPAQQTIGMTPEQWQQLIGTLKDIAQHLPLGKYTLAGAADRAEQWYAIDDVVVSTSYIGPDYVIGGDVTAPEFSSSAGNAEIVSLVFTESVTGLPTAGDFTMECGAGAINLTYVSGSGSSVYILDAATPAANGETCTIAYDGAGELADDASNVLADFTAQSMTNNTPAEQAAVIIPNRGVNTGSGAGLATYIGNGPGIFIRSY